MKSHLAMALPISASSFCRRIGNTDLPAVCLEADVNLLAMSQTVFKGPS